MLGGRISCDLEEFEEEEGMSVLLAALASLRMLGGKIAGFDLEEFGQHKLKRDSSVDRISGRVDKDIYYWEPKSLRIRAINWWHVFLAEYLTYVYNTAIAGAVLLILSQIWYGHFDLSRFRVLLGDPIVLEVICLVAVVMAYMSHWKPAVYCMENVVYTPPQEWQVSQKDLVDIISNLGCFSPDSLEFQKRILDSSGTGESTHWPPGILTMKDSAGVLDAGIASARDEAKEVIFTLVRDVLQRTGVRPTAIDILIINCSLFCPTPSLCALVCNEFCLRQDVRTYNLGGMGCSANVISVDLAKQLLQNQPGARALVISTENITQNMYKGNEKGMLLQNTLFRCGGCALLLSSRRVDALRAKYKLLYTFRCQLSDNDSYKCVYQEEDAEGNCGVSLSKDIVKVAGRAMRQNFVMLGPYVLPIREQAAVVFNQLAVRFVSLARRRHWPIVEHWEIPKGYTPDFGKSIDHFCIHAGGRAVIEGVKKNLGLSDRQVAPSVQTLYDWGNTSSSSIWYEMDWVERWAGLRRGERILQIAFGSGFKCNSAVWVALRVDVTKRRRPLKQDAAASPGASPGASLGAGSPEPPPQAAPNGASGAHVASKKVK
mmetsp:Transcript_149972/g.481933  ORF Transcript_149972/g.481933 Transcript_149972/m.481933 type:complete len:601 (+) Transcript_149972:245-2047(+)